MSINKLQSGVLFIVMWPLAVWLLGGCVAPPDKPETREMAALGISVETHWNSVGWLGGMPEWVHFVRWNDEDDLLKQTEIITSNYQSGERRYFLNAKPGRYSAIATTELVSRGPRNDPVVTAPQAGDGRAMTVSWRGGRTKHLATMDFDSPGAKENFMLTTYFSEELIRKTMVEVKPGAMAFMGRFLVVRDRAIGKGDRAQKHFKPLENPTLLDYLGIQVTPSEFDASRSIDMRITRDKGAESEFLAAALRDLGGTGWENAVQRSIQAMPSN